MTTQQERMRALVEAGITLSSDLSLERVLQRLVDVAAELAGARYAALAVIDRPGRVERFLTSGISAEEAAKIGHPPLGRGILGVLIDEGTPLRLHDLTQDPRSVGFPPGHPPMTTFLGVPIALRRVAYGNLYLAEKAGGEDFTDEDEEMLLLLAGQAAVSIENARLYESATRWLRRLESMTEVGTAIASETDLPNLLDLIATRLRELIGARVVFIALATPERELQIEAAADEQGGVRHGLGVHISRALSKSARALERRRAERVDSLIDDVELDREALRQLAKLTGIPFPSTGLFVPLLVHDQAIGVICAHDKLDGNEGDLRFTDDDMRVAEWFGQRAAVAVDLSRRIQRDALRRVVTAQELERKRLARELHDETSQALTSILLGLRTLESARTLEDVRPAAETLRQTVTQTLQEVRRLAVELRPAVLDDYGLVPALERLVETFGNQTGLDVQLETRLAERLPPELETALYRIVQEALTNVAKHARARHVSILLTRKPPGVAVVVEDDGQGFSTERESEAGLGLLGMRERLALLDGTLLIESAPGAGTTLVVEAPLP